MTKPEELPITPGDAMPKGEWTVEYTASSPMKGRRKGERTYAQADVYSGELIPGGKRCYADGREEPLYREVVHMAYNDQDPASEARAKAICSLITDAGTTYNRTKVLPSDLAERLEEALGLLRVSACPNCDGGGWYAVPSMPDGEPELVQCQFCYERHGILTRTKQPEE